MTAEKKKLLIEAYDAFFSMLIGEFPLERSGDYVADDVMGFGTTLDEKIFDIDNFRKAIVRQRVQSVGIEFHFDLNPVFRRIDAGEQTAIFVDEVLTTMLMDGGKNEIPLRISTIFEFKDDAWKLVHWHGSVAIVTEEDPWHKDEWKRRNEELQKLVNEKTVALKKSLEELKSTQSQLIHSEKMASLGELTAGIAHEIQNPLNFVNNFSELNRELIDEMEQEMDKGNLKDAKAIAKDLRENEEKINQHGKRADSIVKGMLQHSRTSSGVKEPTDINKLADEYLRLAYYGIRAKDKSFNATLKTEYDEGIGNFNMNPQEIGRVILNLVNNAFYAVSEKKKHQPVGYEPSVFLTTKKVNGKIEIAVKDNGNGIPQKILDKIFQPFFTTKPTGQGTGLGLSLAYDIVKAHGGELKVKSKEDVGSEFIIQF